MNNNVTTDDLLRIIGRQQVELEVLRAQFQAVQQQLQALAPPATRRQTVRTNGYGEPVIEEQAVS